MILGEPNAGKSTLLNHLAKQDVAITSDIPGTTRDIVEVNLDINGYSVRIADTAGIRKSGNKIESEGIRRSMAKSNEADIKLVLFPFDKLPDLNQETLALINEKSIPIISKMDHIEDGLYKVHVDHHKIDFIPISVLNNKGTEYLLEKIEEKMALDKSYKESPLITRERHRIQLQSGLGTSF